MIDDESHSEQLSLGSLKAFSVLGRGAKGVVFLASNGNDLFALKVISKALIAENQRKKAEKMKKRCAEDVDEVDERSSEFVVGSEYKRIWFERDVLKRLQHPLLPKLRGFVENEKIFGYAMDYCPGRDLNSLRRKQSEKTFSDDIIRFYAAELVLILDYLHKLGIVYRDLKPENVMIQASGHLMLVDFDLSAKLMVKSPGLSSRTSSCSSSSSTASSHRTSTSSLSAKSLTLKPKRLSNFYQWCSAGNEQQQQSIEHESVSARSDNLPSVVKSNSFVGTEEYVPPEIISGDGHDFKVDWWSLGVVLYEMLYGVTPFVGSNRKETFYRVLSKMPELVGEATPLRDLIRKLLEKDPKKRIGVEDIKGHAFFNGICWETVAEISRPPWIPLLDEECDLSGGAVIDVESFVEGLFSSNADGEGCRINEDGEVEKEKRERCLNHPHSQTNDFLGRITLDLPWLLAKSTIRSKRQPTAESGVLDSSVPTQAAKLQHKEYNVPAIQLLKSFILAAREAMHVK